MNMKQAAAQLQRVMANMLTMDMKRRRAAESRPKKSAAKRTVKTPRKARSTRSR